MKRVSFKVLAIAAVLLVVFATTAFAATATTYTAGETFYTTAPGAGEVWFYQYDDGTGYKNEPKVFSGWGIDIWVMAADPNTAGPYANINADAGKMVLHPDKNADGTPINVAVAFKAPSDGTVVIPATTATHKGYNDPDDDKGTKVWIELGGEKYNETAIGYESSAEVAGKTLEVKAGDMVRFVANNNGRGGNNNTYWDINLAFTPAEAAAAVTTDTTTATAEESPKTGDNGIALYGSFALLAVVAMMVIRKKRIN